MNSNSKNDLANNKSLTAVEFINKLKSFLTPLDREKFESLQKDQLIDDIQWDIRMRDVFALAKEFIDLPLSQIEELLQSPVHKVRVGAVSIMDFQARNKKTSEKQKRALFDLYIRSLSRINTWDLVDRSAIYVVGQYLFDKPHEREILYSLAKSDNMPARRTAIVATLYFVGRGDFEDTFKIAEILLNDKDDLVNKATGWALRSIGGQELVSFLDKYSSKMPRVTLRYSIEKMPKEQRDYYLKKKN